MRFAPSDYQRCVWWTSAEARPCVLHPHTRAARCSRWLLRTVPPSMAPWPIASIARGTRRLHCVCVWRALVGCSTPGEAGYGLQDGMGWNWALPVFDVMLSSVRVCPTACPLLPSAHHCDRHNAVRVAVPTQLARPVPSITHIETAAGDRSQRSCQRRHVCRSSATALVWWAEPRPAFHADSKRASVRRPLPPEYIEILYCIELIVLH